MTPDAEIASQPDGRPGEEHALGIGSPPHQRLGGLAFTAYHAQVAALSVLTNHVDGRRLMPTLSAAHVDIRPHQVECAVFGLQSPLAPGVLLADETGLGKTIEAGIVIAQRWAERRRAILLIVPALLRGQWRDELANKFGLRADILDGPGMDAALEERGSLAGARILIVSFGVASANAVALQQTPWDLVVVDEAHRLRNVYKAAPKSQSRVIRAALRGRTKLLLTATPLQNSLAELHGLMSFIDDDMLGTIGDFDVLYKRNPKAADLERLADLIRPFVKRHLRSDVQRSGHVAFTDRIAVTYVFEPSEQEHELYELVSAYLQRDATLAFGSPPNPLILSTARKILASSTAALAGFLRHVLIRLRRFEAMDAAALDDVEHMVAAVRKARGVEDARARPGADAVVAGPHAPTDIGRATAPSAFIGEIGEVEGYLALAESITADAKSESLIKAIPGVLDDVCGRGGRRKAVLFTESRRTQEFLTALLRERGLVEQVITLNGSNEDAESARIHREWCDRHAVDGSVSGSRGADRRAAIVEAFRNATSAVLVSTESGGEGVNLQFCSLVINYDLPWNPQRLEQRIGRCHRYGQAVDVLVLNLQNGRNRVEERVLHLLTRKFKIFEGVFGASDTVLGAVEAAVNFEAEVSLIAQSCRSDAEVEREFEALERRLEAAIAGDLAAARRALFDAVDEDVIARLEARDRSTLNLLDDFTRRLGIIVRAELPAAVLDDRAPLTFRIDKTAWTTRWTDVRADGPRHFALGDDNWASKVVGRAAARSLPVAGLRFDLDALRRAGFARLSDVENYAGRAGWLRVAHLAFTTALETAAPRGALVFAGLSDDGEMLDADTAQRFFLVPGEVFDVADVAVPGARLDEVVGAEQARLIDIAKMQSAAWQAAEGDKLDMRVRDVRRAAELRSKELSEQADGMRARLRRRRDLSPVEMLQARREIEKIERESDGIILNLASKLEELRVKRDRNLDNIEFSLRISTKMSYIFGLRWEILN